MIATAVLASSTGVLGVMLLVVCCCCYRLRRMLLLGVRKRNSKIYVLLLVSSLAQNDEDLLNLVSNVTAMS